MAGVRNLTQVEAAERARLLDVTAYDITLDLTDGAGDPGERHVPVGHRGAVHLRRAGRRHVHRGRRRPVRSRDAQRRSRSTRRGWSAETGLPLTGLAAENVLVVDADFAYSTTGQGLHRSVDPVDKEVYLYSQFETADAQRVFACFDQPDLKSVFTLHVTVAGALAGHLQHAGRAPRSGDEAPRRSTSSRRPRMSTYITALCAGPYHEVRDTPRRHRPGRLLPRSR